MSLSDKIIERNSIEETLHIEDVKEFIKKLKINIQVWNFKKQNTKELHKFQCDIIDKLAGEKLI